MNSTYLFESFSLMLSQFYNENNFTFNVDDLDIALVSYNAFGEEQPIDLKSVLL